MNDRLERVGRERRRRGEDIIVGNVLLDLRYLGNSQDQHRQIKAEKAAAAKVVSYTGLASYGSRNDVQTEVNAAISVRVCPPTSLPFPNTTGCNGSKMDKPLLPAPRNSYRPAARIKRRSSMLTACGDSLLRLLILPFHASAPPSPEASGCIA